MDFPEQDHYGHYGDGEWIEGDENSKWEKKKLGNLVIPFFPKHAKSKIQHQQYQNQNQGERTSNLIAGRIAGLTRFNCDYSEELIFLECALCMDILVQATAAPCGHVFCFRCINAWKSYRNWCPICQASISSTFSSGLTRIYILDELVEQVLWPQLSANTRMLINEAMTERSVELTLKRKAYKNSYWSKIVGFFESIRIHAGSKGWWGALAYPFRGFWAACCEFFSDCCGLGGSAWFELNCSKIGNVVKMCLLVLLGCLICGPCSLMSIPATILEFFAYMIHCIYIYPGWSGDFINLSGGGA